MRRGAFETSIRRPHGARGLRFVLLALVMACGEAPPVAAGDAGDSGASCSPQLSAGWMPQWKPPRAPEPGACSEDQIEREYRACEATAATGATCADFRDDPSNTGCIGCLFSAEGDATYGAIIRVGSSWKTNTAGCIALSDGDRGPTGCGARVQAASACYDDACAGCTPFAAYTECREVAMETTCRQRYLDAVCLLRPQYAPCTAYVSNEDYFFAAARLFCGPMKKPSSRLARGDLP
jgi:hypothetical protein